MVSGLAVAVPELPLEDRWGQRCSSPVATAREPRPVVQRRHDRVVDEPSVDGADEKKQIWASNTWDVLAHRQHGGYPRRAVQTDDELWLCELVQREWRSAVCWLAPCRRLAVIVSLAWPPYLSHAGAVNARHVIARHENAAHKCSGGKCRKKFVWKAITTWMIKNTQFLFNAQNTTRVKYRRIKMNNTSQQTVKVSKLQQLKMHHKPKINAQI